LNFISKTNFKISTKAIKDNIVMLLIFVLNLIAARYLSARAS